MKSVACLFFFAILSFAHADDANLGVTRAKMIEDVRRILNDPKATDKERATAAVMAMSILDEDTKILDSDAKLIDSDAKLIKVKTDTYDALVKLCKMGVLPDGVKPFLTTGSEKTTTIIVPVITNAPSSTAPASASASSAQRK